MSNYRLPTIAFAATLVLAVAGFGLLVDRHDPPEPVVAPLEMGEIPHRGLQIPWWEQIRIVDTPPPALPPVPTTAPPADQPVDDTVPTTTVATPSDEPSSEPEPAAAPTVLRTFEVPADVYFATDEVDLTENGIAEIERLALDELADAVAITVAGCTDPRGSAEHNREIAAGRAAGTADVLVSSGIDPTVITTEAWADTQLTERQPGQDEAEWFAENRRIVIVAMFEVPADEAT